MRFQKLYDQRAGGMPLHPMPFSVTGRNQLLLISGSVNPRRQHVDMEVKVFVDGPVPVGVLKIKNNQADQHLHVALVSAFIPLQLGPRAGNPYSLLLQPTNLGGNQDVAVGGDDYWDIVLIDDGN